MCIYMYIRYLKLNKKLNNKRFKKLIKIIININHGSYYTLDSF